MEVSRRGKIILGFIRGIIKMALNILFYAVVVIAISRACVFAYDFSYKIFGDVSVEAEPGKDTPIEVKTGEGTMVLAQKLENMGLVEDKYSFYVRAKLSTGSKKPILPGSYRLNTSMNYEEIIYVITNESAQVIPLEN